MTVEKMIKKTEYDVEDDCKSICVYAIGDKHKIFTINKCACSSNNVNYTVWSVISLGDTIALITYDSFEESYELIKKLTYIFDTVYVNSYSL